MTSEKRKIYSLIALIFLCSLILRLWGITFGFPLKYARPDENSIVEASLYFFTGDLNPHFFYYPHLFLYINYFVYSVIYFSGKIAGIFNETGDFLQYFLLSPSIFFIVPRIISALAGSITVIVAYIIGERFYSRKTGIFAALILSVTYLHVRDSHFGTIDILLSLVIFSSMLVLRNIVKKGDGYIVAGILGGVASGIKYNGAILAVSIFTAHLLNCRKGERWWKNTFISLKLLLAAVLMVVSFVCSSPGLFLEFERFVKKLNFMAEFVQKGTSIGVDIGWVFYLKTSLLHGMGLPLLVVSLIGVLYALWKHSEEDILLISFPIVYYLYIGNGYGVFSRYMVPIIPFLVIFASRFIADLLLGLNLEKKLSRIMIICFFMIIIVPPLSKSVKFDILISKEDTRVTAEKWIEENIPFGTGIYLHGPYEYNLPYLEMNKKSLDKEIQILNKIANNKNRYNLYLMIYDYLLSHDKYPLSSSYERFRGINLEENELIGKGVTYIITGEYLLDYYSGENERISSLLNKRFFLFKEFLPYDSRIEIMKKSVFDVLDAFYLPFDGFNGIKSPGPLIRIYKLKEM